MDTMDPWQGRVCIRCGRTHGIDTTLNIEGYIHHGLEFVCKDNTSCGRLQRKNKKRAKIKK